MSFDLNELKNRFDYHRPPNEKAVKHHERVRVVLLDAATAVTTEVFAGIGADTHRGRRELALVYTKLEEAMFWANAALARNWPESADGVQQAPTVQE